MSKINSRVFKLGLRLAMLAIVLSPINALAATQYVYTTTATASSETGTVITTEEEIIVDEPTVEEAVLESNLINPGFEIAGDNGSQAFGWNPFQSGYERVSTHREGDYGIRLQNSNDSMTSGAYQRFDLDQESLSPVFIGGYVKGENIVNSSSGYFGASIYAEIHLVNGSVVYWNSNPNYGTFDWRWIGFDTKDLVQINSPISYIYVVPILSQAVGTAYFDDVNVFDGEVNVEPPVEIVPPPVTDSVLINPSFETAGASESEAYGWHPFHAGYTRVSTHREGSYGISLTNSDYSTLSGAYQRFDLNQDELKPVFVGGYISGSNIVNSPNGYFGASLYAEIYMTDGSVAYWNSIANYGTFGWRWVGFNTGTLSQVNAPISHIFVVPIMSQAIGTAYYDDIIVKENDPVSPAITIMIDDGELNTYTEAKPVLDQYGFDASVAIATGLINDPDFMTWSQLTELYNDGWEIVSHGTTHSDMTMMNANQAIRELRDSKRLLQRRGFAVNNFAFPFGAYNGDLIGKAATYYSSTRLYEQGDNPQGAFPYDIKVRGMLDTTSPDDVSAWIEEAKSNNSWIILTFHSIASEGVDAYHSTPEVFKSIVDTIAGSGVDVITYNEGIERYASKQQ